MRSRNAFCFSALPWIVVGTVALLGVHLGALGSYGGSSRGCWTLWITRDATAYVLFLLCYCLGVDEASVASYTDLFTVAKGPGALYASLEQLRKSRFVLQLILG